MEKSNTDRVIKFFIILGLIIYIFIISGLFWLANELPYNSKKRLNIVNPYGSIEAYNPKVLNFEEKWNGYKYWMSYTPYCLGDDSKENPCIVVSNDMINWESITEENKALNEPEQTKKKKIYNSDSYLVYNNDLNRLECYWRFVNYDKDKIIIYRTTTTDGINWTEKEISYETKESKKDCISPAILYENGTYKCWFANNANKLVYMESEDGLKWTSPKTLSFSYGAYGVKLWNLDIIKQNGKYEIISVAFVDYEHRNSMSLYYSSSEDGTTWQTNEKILAPTSGTKNWDNKGLYRSSFIYENGNYYVFYSGGGKDKQRGIGLVYGKSILDLTKVRTNFESKEQSDKLIKKINKITNN